MSEANLGHGNVDLVLETLLAVEELADSNVRSGLVTELRTVLRRPFDAPRSADVRRDLSLLIEACLAHTGGLRALARALQRKYPGEASSHVVALVEETLGSTVLSHPDREALRGHLADVAIVQIADAVAELVEADELRSLQSWRDIPAAIHSLERLPLSGDGIPQLMRFAERLVQLIGEPKAGQLRQWLDAVAGGLGIDPTMQEQLRAAGETDDSHGRSLGARADTASATANPPPRAAVIWGGGVPIRNRNFTGRVPLLDRLGDALRNTSKASVVPQTLHGMGGVGKTQLVVEYVYRNLNQYDLVWWIPAEQTSSVLNSLSQLAERLGLVTTIEDQQLTARTVLDALASSELSWLLVYDNADEVDVLNQLIPSTGGHVVLTSRNQAWADVGPPIEVDIFERHESIELLQKRTKDEETGEFRISGSEADELAEKLGDLPLALEQAAAWYLATAMPVQEYLDLLDTHIKDLLSEGKPANYPLTVAAFVSLTVQQLRATAPATAHLFELFAFLGGQPVAVALLRAGKDADVSEPLRTMLGATIPMNRAVRTLSRYGLAKVDPTQRVQVHRLVQLVLRDSFSKELARQTLNNVQSLLAAANPGDPDEQRQLHLQRELGQHIKPADLVHAESLAARQVVVDHMRYLWVVGDYETSRQLASEAVKAWRQETSHPRLGPDGDLTLAASAHEANATRALGGSGPAAEMAREAYDRMRRSPEIGPMHELTLITGNHIGLNLRIEGKYQEALEFDRESVALHKEVFGPAEANTLRAQNNLAVDYRLVGDFVKAFQIERELATHWEDVGGSDHRAVAAHINMARSYYGMGAYQAGLDIVERWRSPLLDLLGPRNNQVLLAGRTYGILLRKLGRLQEAAEVIQENQERVRNRFGVDHEFTVAVNLSYVNLLRELGDLDEALRQMAETVSRYERNYGHSHPLTLVAKVNQAIILRASGDLVQARNIDQRCYDELTRILTRDHPYTKCAGTSLATDYALAGEHRAALELSKLMYELSEPTAGGGRDARGGVDHPYALMRGVNLAADHLAVGDTQAGEELRTKSIRGLRQSLGSEHPQVIAIEHGERPEGDIEAPPT